jgi:hypothetical protein
MSEILHVIEKVYRRALWEVQIPVLITSLGIKVKIFRIPSGDMYHSVYGVAAGANEGVDKAVEIGEITALIVGDEWTQTDIRSVGTFKEGWMYCRIPDMYGPGGNVFSFQDNNHGGTRVTTDAPHGLSNTEMVYIYNSVHYNGYYKIFDTYLGITEITFDIPRIFTLDETGKWATVKVKEGDVIKFSDRQDTKIRRYKVEAMETFGNTIEIVQRFRLSTLGD